MDDSSHYNYLFMIHENSQVYGVFKIFKVEVENQLNKNIKVIKSNNYGEEYYDRYDGLSEQHLWYTRTFSHGVQDHSQYIMPKTPSQNSVFER